MSVIFPFRSAERIITSQALHAVKAVHSLGFIHRDLKPDNLFFDIHDDSLLKVGDFGLSKRMSEVAGYPADGSDVSAGRRDVIVSGSITKYIGTTLYMAPEVSRF